MITEDSMRTVLALYREELEKEKTYAIPQYDRILGQLRGMAILTAGHDRHNPEHIELVAELYELIDEVRALID